MRNTMLPPWLRAESHAHRQLNTLPRCMRPEGDGAKRPTTGAGAGTSLLLVAVDVATAGVASPVLVHWAAGERSAAVLAAMKNWIVRNNAVIVSAVLLLLGAVLLNKGLGQMAQMHQLQGLPLR